MATIQKVQLEGAGEVASSLAQIAQASVEEAEYNLRVALAGHRDHHRDRDVEKQLQIERAAQALTEAKQRQLDVKRQAREAPEEVKRTRDEARILSHEEDLAEIRMNAARVLGQMISMKKNGMEPPGGW